MNMSRIAVSKQINPTPSGSVIFLHGSGDTGNGIKMWINQILGKELQFPHLRVLYPTAPLLPYTPMGGVRSNVWFDRESISPEVPECLESVNSSADSIKSLIEKEVESGIPFERIIIGGFSMGGAMALHMAYRVLPRISGCFAISSFLNDSSVVYKTLKTNVGKQQPPLVMMHGDSDSLVPSDWGMKTYTNLKKFGIDGSISIMKNVSHEITEEEILTLINWINTKIPIS